MSLLDGAVRLVSIWLYATLVTAAALVVVVTLELLTHAVRQR